MTVGKYIRTEEHKRKISEGNKNRYIKNPLLKIQISNSLKGRKKSEITKKRMRESNRIVSKSFKGRGRHCGFKCSFETRLKLSESNKGNKHWNWKGGISTEHDKIRHTFEIELWKKSCMVRDNFTCQKTGIKGGTLNVHHINNFADFPELRTSIENGITLSKEVHIEFHKKYGKRNNTIEQLEEFKGSLL